MPKLHLPFSLLLFLFLSGPQALAQPQYQAVVLQYHHVSSSTPRSTSVSVEEFRSHLQYLHGNGFVVLPLQDIVAALKRGQPLPDKAIALSFDDAYLSVYTAAYPLLKSYGWPFTVFVPSGLVGSNPKLYASWDQLREMAKAGATLANHSVGHPYFMTKTPGESAALWLARVEKEIVDAEANILAETGQSHHLHAYPYGEYDAQIAALLTRLGYVGFGQHSGAINASSDFTALPRFPFSGNYASLKSLIPKANSLAFDVTVVEPSTPLTQEQTPSATLQFNAAYRFDKLACYVNDQPLQVAAIDKAKRLFRVSSAHPQKGRRFRYNCTAPGPAGRFYWFALPWLNPALPDR
jgi:poly-beta-1,6-N-acetyl-D-glucosamine N-deacetylase